jgi:hypothetical protein
MDGEELVGAKQNRTVNLTILVPAKAEVEIPVTCVEAGRWRYRSRHFAAAPRAHYATGRAMKARQVTDNLLSLGERYADQCAVWDDIAGKSARLGALSETSAMDAMYEQAAADLADVAEKLAPSEGQCGAVFTIDGAVVGMDLFDAAATFRKLLPKLAHSYGLDALDRRAAGAVHAKADVRKFLQAVAEADWQEFAAIGLGQDLRLEGQALAGGALVANGSVVHISAFQW